MTRSRPIALRLDEARRLTRGQLTHIMRPVRWPISSYADDGRSRLFLLNDNDIEKVNQLLAIRQRKRHPNQCLKSPVGQKDDLLWVRETFGWDEDGPHAGPLVYRADSDDSIRWRSPMHMPRWASRFTLRVISVWVSQQRLLRDEYFWCAAVAQEGEAP